MPIVAFLAKRVAAMAAILLLVSFLAFSLLTLSPVSEVAVLLGSRPATPETIAGITAQYRLDDPFFTRYWLWLVDAVRGDFGASVQSGQSVTGVIASHFPLTLQLGLYAFVLVLVAGLPLGLAAGIRRGCLLDRATSAFTVIGMSAPGFAVGIVLIYVFGVRLGWFPVYGGGNGHFVSTVVHLTLPAIALAIGLSALVVRQTRAAALDVMEQDYITFAKARGVSGTRVLIGYLLRNTALPVVTAAGLMLIAAVSGAVVVETVFSVPGIGQLMVKSIEVKDIPMVQGITFFVALAVLAVNLAVDAAVLILDPRTRISGRRRG
ncbi:MULTISPECIES: ABC transporter permease [Amycolatopsis]|nr:MULTISPECIES: ABC transporter permease [Amycolatopsis]OAP23958.1 Dipeptide transport system permease protein DppB [Amycolatopsis sp. M39]